MSNAVQNSTVNGNGTPVSKSNFKEQVGLVWQQIGNINSEKAYFNFHLSLNCISLPRYTFIQIVCKIQSFQLKTIK